MCYNKVGRAFRPTLLFNEEDQINADVSAFEVIMARKSFKAGALTAPLPPVMVTVGTGENVNVLTIAWTGILSTIPPRTYISVRPARHSYKLLRESGEFVINLPSADLARTVDYVGIYTGAKVNKIKECGLDTVPSEKVAVPTLAGCPFALECRVVEVIPMGTHDVFIADIVSVSADDSILDENGRICFDKANLLAYAHGEYFALGEKLGKFGFSTNKPDRAARGARTERREGATRTAEDKRDPKKKKKPASEDQGETRRTKPAVDDKRGKKGVKSHTPPTVGAENERETTKSTAESRPFYLTAPKGRGGRKSGKGKGKKR